MREASARLLYPEFIALCVFVVFSLGTSVSEAGPSNPSASSTPSALPKTKIKKPAPKKSRSETAREEPPILAGAAITVLKFDRSTRTLVVSINDEPAVGPNIATPQSLIDAIGFESEDRKAYLDDPSRFVGAEYTLRKDLQLLAPESLPSK